MFSSPIGELDRSARGERGAHAATFVQHFGVVGQDEEDEQGKKKNRSAPAPSQGLRNAPEDIDIGPVGTLSDEEDNLSAAPPSQSGAKRTADVMDEENELEDEIRSVVPERKEQKRDHWVLHFLKKVPFDKSKLSGIAAQAVSKMDEFPTHMYQCQVPQHFTGSGTHFEYLLLPARGREMHSNLVSHFEGHAQIKKYMETAVANGEELERAAAACYSMLEAQAKKSGSMHAFVRRNPREKEEEGLLKRERQEVALAVWLIDTRTPLYRLQLSSWSNFCSEIGLAEIKPEQLRRIHYMNIFECLLRIRRRLFLGAGFVHVEFDFLSSGSTKFLLVCGRTVVGFKLFNDILGVVEFVGVQSAEHVSQLVDVTVGRVCGNAVVLSTVTVDGALRAAASELVEEEDTWWCVLHQWALPIKKSLDNDSIVALDFRFMHLFGVFLRSHAHFAEALDLIQRQQQRAPKQMLLDSLARWTSEYRKLKRFLELQTVFIQFAKRDDVRSVVTEWVADKKAPKDAFKPTFFSRLEAMMCVMGVVHSVVKRAQSPSTPVLSMIPFYLQRIEKTLILEEDEPVAVQDWKTSFRALLEKQFADFKTVSIMWLAVALDPRFADLSVFGVSASFSDEVWERIQDEHLNFKALRLEMNGLELSKEREDVSKALVSQTRQSLVFASRKLAVEFKGDPEKIYSFDPLSWWQEMSEKGKADDNFLEYREVAGTACMLLSSPGTTAASERGVGRFRNSLTPFRTMLTEGMLEQEVVASHFIRTSNYSFNELCKELGQLQRELTKKK